MPPNSVVKMVESASRMWPARAACGGIHSKSRELLIAGFREGMRPVEIDGLPRQHLHRFAVLGGQLRSAAGGCGS